MKSRREWHECHLCDRMKARILLWEEGDFDPGWRPLTQTWECVDCYQAKENRKPWRKAGRLGMVNADKHWRHEYGRIIPIYFRSRGD